eukprot:scaffold264884_cov28-Attheya_sp.AAC.1
MNLPTDNADRVQKALRAFELSMSRVCNLSRVVCLLWRLGHNTRSPARASHHKPEDNAFE